MRTNHLLVLATLSLLPLSALGESPHSDPIAEARTTFEKLIALEQAYDIAVADLYDDNALIKNRRIYPDGQVREMTLTGSQYKALIRQVMPLAKARGDRGTYSEVVYTMEGESVRITASRFSELKQYTSPLSLLVSPSGDGSWLIVEEISESKP